jgi:hypothetical protein
MLTGVAQRQRVGVMSPGKMPGGLCGSATCLSNKYLSIRAPRSSAPVLSIQRSSDQKKLKKNADEGGAGTPGAPELE